MGICSLLTKLQGCLIYIKFLLDDVVNTGELLINPFYDCDSTCKHFHPTKQPAYNHMLNYNNCIKEARSIQQRLTSLYQENMIEIMLINTKMDDSLKSVARLKNHRLEKKKNRRFNVEINKKIRVIFKFYLIIKFLVSIR